MNEIVRVAEVHFTRGAQEVLRGVSFTLHGGEKVGLVGSNGAGKTTLLSLVAGVGVPTDGRIVRAPGLRYGYAEQLTTAWRGTVWAVAAGGLAYVRGLEAALRELETCLDDARLAEYGELTALFEGVGGYEAEATLRTHLSRLGFSEADYGRDVTTLSGGERARLGLARALAERPDLLLLDEPSSYLDLPTKRWLAETLARSPDTMLLASHDRALLDAVCGRTLELKAGVVTSYRGGYSRYRAQASHALARALRQASRAAHEKRALTERIRTQPTLSTRRSLERRLSRLPDAPTVAAPEESSLTLRGAHVRPNSLLLDARHLSLTRDRPLLQDASLRLYAGDKLAVVGPNGSGKTSLLELLTGDEASEHPEASVRLSRGVRVAVFDQHNRGLEDGVAVGEQLSRNVSEPRARSLLALVGLADAFDRPPEALSGGERARAGVALLMASEANLLLLDEPSEHLDVEMIEKLQTALQDTAAAIILASHDAALIDAVATRLLGLDGGELKEYRGGLAGYYAGTLRLEPDLPGAPAEADEAAPEPDPEAELVALEDETAATENLLTDPLRLTERDQLRLKRRLKELLHLRSERYDARLPAPLPRYRAVESGVEVTTNGGGRPIVFDSSAGQVILYVDAATGVGHLLLRNAQGRCPLPWAEQAMVRGAARLAFEVFGARALQVQRESDFSQIGFEAAGDGWWVQDRDRYARREGYVRSGSSPPRARRRRRRKVAV